MKTLNLTPSPACPRSTTKPTRHRPVAQHRAPSPLQSERNRRVTAYRELVRPLAVHYARVSGQCAEDLEQVGLLGLIRAAERFNPDRGTAFGPFARPHVRGAILHYLRDTAPVVRLPRRQEELRQRLRQLEAEHQDQPAATADDACCKGLGITLAHLRMVEQWQGLRQPRRLEPEAWEAIPAPGAEPSGAPHDGQKLRQLLNLLEPRSRWVVARVVLAGWSYRQTARPLGVSAMTVQRLLHRALATLRQELQRQGVSPGSVPAGPAPSAAPGC